ncbi:uncharacterized protein LOC113937170 [Zalophus californianus]|uniref:Uncharacterized protein LOC113937170 n=1 Tax=Zalophus californianus TaxID=9704 RepID=A0A6J2F5Z0_ZALCA|nr:uncharacterized protein LOC113937170 [Zalophus californianus]
MVESPAQCWERHTGSSPLPSSAHPSPLPHVPGSALFLSASQFPIVVHLHLEPPCLANGPPHPDWALCKTCQVSSSPSQYHATIQQAWALGGHPETRSVSGGHLKGLVSPAWDLDTRTHLPPVRWLGAGGGTLLRASSGLTELKIGDIYHFPAICKPVTWPAKIRLERTPAIRKSNLRYLISGSLLSVPTAPVRLASLALFQVWKQSRQAPALRGSPPTQPLQHQLPPKGLSASSRAAAQAFGALPLAGQCRCLWVFWKGSQPHVSLTLLCLDSNTSPHRSPRSDLPFPGLVIRQDLNGECCFLFALHTVGELQKEMLFPQTGAEQRFWLGSDHQVSPSGKTRQPGSPGASRLSAPQQQPGSRLRGGRTPRVHTAPQPSRPPSPKPKFPLGLSVSGWVQGALCPHVLPQLALLGWGPRPQTVGPAGRGVRPILLTPSPAPAAPPARTPACTSPWRELTCPSSRCQPGMQISHSGRDPPV